MQGTLQGRLPSHCLCSSQTDATLVVNHYGQGDFKMSDAILFICPLALTPLNGRQTLVAAVCYSPIQTILHRPISPTHTGLDAHRS